METAWIEVRGGRLEVLDDDSEDVCAGCELDVVIEDMARIGRISGRATAGRHLSGKTTCGFLIKGRIATIRRWNEPELSVC